MQIEVSRTVPMMDSQSEPPHSGWCWCSSHEQRLTHSHPCELLNDTESLKGLNLLDALHAKQPPPWMVPLPLQVPLPSYVHDSLSRLIVQSTQQGARHGIHNILEETIVRPPNAFSQYISGNTEKAQRFSSPMMSGFMASLFYAIQTFSCTRVELRGWDLYHGHMFLCPGGEESTLPADLGILFHAKEFPSEYRTSPYSPHKPIGDPKRGGEKDPRVGTEISVGDSDYSLRNYLWLFSTNTIYVMDPTHPEFDRSLLTDLAGKEFFTCHERVFSSVILGDLNFFPNLFDSSPEIDELAAKLSCESENVITKQRQKYAYPHQILEAKYAHRMADGSLFHEEARKLLHMVQDSPVCSSNVIFCSRPGIPLSLQLFNGLLNFRRNISLQTEEEMHLTVVLACVGESEVDGLVTLIETIHSTTDVPSCLVHVRELHCPEVFSALSNRKEIIARNKEVYNAAQLQDLLERKVDPEHAKECLVHTAFEGLWSSFKSIQLLGAAFAQYRDEKEREQYGDTDYELQEVLEVWKHTFYSWATLHALRMIFEEGLSQELAIRSAMDAVTAQMDEKMQLNLTTPSGPPEKKDSEAQEEQKSDAESDSDVPNKIDENKV